MCIVVMNSYVMYACIHARIYALLMVITNSRLLANFSIAWHTCFVDAYFVFTSCKLLTGYSFKIRSQLRMSIEMYGANLREIRHFEKS